MRKYRRRGTTSIGFGLDLADPMKSFHFAIWASWPWQHDSEIENLLKEDIHSIPVAGQRLPGPSEHVSAVALRSLRSVAET